MQEDAPRAENQIEETQAKSGHARSVYGEQGVHGYDLSLFRENLRRTPTERIERLQSAHNFFFDLRTLKNTHNFTLTTDVGDIDLLAEPAGVDSFEGLWNRATVMEIYGMHVRVASVEDLIAMKRAAGRPKDMQHLMELLDLQQFLIDEA